MSESTVNLRAQHILKLVVERYIEEGAPIGSRALAEDSALGLSPATIRNILADLEEAGYLASPHTSAGRVPTPLGYRLFVNGLLTAKPFESIDLHTVQQQLNPDLALPNLLHSASSLLSGLTHMVGVVALPKRNRLKLRQLEFLSLPGNRILVILVLNNREVQNRVIHTQRVFSASELEQAANYLNSHYVGKDLADIRADLYASMQTDKNAVTQLLQAALEMSTQVMSEDTSNQDYIMAGQNQLLGNAKKEELERLQDLFQAFTQKQDIINLLDHSLEAEGIQIFIGRESGYEAFDNCSIVTTSYAADGQLIGSLGVIGPMRMPYDRVITAVDVTAKLLSAALNQG